MLLYSALVDMGMGEIGRVMESFLRSIGRKE